MTSIRNVISHLLREEAHLCGGPRPCVSNTGGHTYKVDICLGKHGNFYKIGTWYKIVSD